MVWVGLLRFVVNSGLAERIQALEIALDDELWHQEELQKRRLESGVEWFFGIWGVEILAPK